MMKLKDPITRFQEFLRLETISGKGPQGIYLKAAEWLKDYIEEVGLSCQIFTFVEGKPIVIAEWIGTSPELPSLLFNSHYDVVPVLKEHWHHDPFKGEILENGFIVGRGTQDMKSVCIQYIEAIRALKTSGFIPVRTMYLTFVPDEEIGGVDGMGALLESAVFKSMLPIGLAFDEGLANPTNAFTVFYGERVPWWLIVKAKGPTGHGSRFIENTAIQKIMEVCKKAMEFRQNQKDRLGLDGGCAHSNMKKKKLGDVTTLNITMMKGGVTMDNGNTWCLNVIPTEFEAGFDVRIAPDMPLEDFKEMMDKWCDDKDVTWKFAEWTSPVDGHYITSLDIETNPWWGKFQDTCKTLGMDIEPEIFPAGTDSRFLRQLGIQALGFSPINNSQVLLHEHNEMLHQDIFLEGISIYRELIKALASTTRFPKEKISLQVSCPISQLNDKSRSTTENPNKKSKIGI